MMTYMDMLIADIIKTSMIAGVHNPSMTASFKSGEDETVSKTRSWPSQRKKVDVRENTQRNPLGNQRQWTTKNNLHGRGS